MSTCDCLTQYDSSLPHKFGCAIDMRDGKSDNTDLRALAEVLTRVYISRRRATARSDGR